MFVKKNTENKKEEKKVPFGMKGNAKEKAVSALKVVILPAMFAGIIVIGLYLSLQNKLEAESLKGHVVVLKEDVSANSFVTKEEFEQYFEVASIEKTAIPSTAYTSLSDFPTEGFYITESMAKKQMVLKDDIATKDQVMDKYKGGYEVTSFAAESFDNSVNGSLRKGDIVDVYAVDPATEMLTLMAENVYISEVYDTSGNQITEDNEVATSFTVWVIPSEVDAINTAVVYGGIQMYLKTK